MRSESWVLGPGSWVAMSQTPVLLCVPPPAAPSGASSSAAQTPRPPSSVTGEDDNWERFGERERRLPTDDELTTWGSQVVLPTKGAVVRARGYKQLAISGRYMVQFTMVPPRSAASTYAFSTYGAQPGDIWYDVEYMCNDQTQWFLPPLDQSCCTVSVGVPDLEHHGRFLQPMFQVIVLNMPMQGYLPSGVWHTWSLDMHWSGILRRVWIPQVQDRERPPLPPPPPPPRQGRGRDRGRGAKGKGKTIYQ